MPRAAQVPDNEIELEDSLPRTVPPTDMPIASLHDARSAGLPTIFLPVAHVRVTRGLDQMTAEVFEHEVEILRMMHGPGNVELTKPPEGEEFVPKELLDSATDEMWRLEHAYANKKANYVRAVYPRGAHDLAAATGMTLTAERTLTPLQSSGRIAGKPVVAGPATRKKVPKVAAKAAKK